jgi:hypothetical protein
MSTRSHPLCAIVILSAGVVAVVAAACTGDTERRAPQANDQMITLPPLIEDAVVDTPPSAVRSALDGAVIGTHRLRVGEFAFPTDCDDGTHTVGKHPVSDGWLTPFGLSAIDTRSRVRYRCDLHWTGTRSIVCFAGPERVGTAAETQQAGGNYQLCAGTDPPVAFVSIANIPPAEWIAVERGTRWIVVNAKDVEAVRVPVTGDKGTIGRVRLRVRWISEDGETLDERTVNAQAAG